MSVQPSPRREVTIEPLAHTVDVDCLLAHADSVSETQVQQLLLPWSGLFMTVLGAAGFLYALAASTWMGAYASLLCLLIAATGTFLLWNRSTYRVCSFSAHEINRALREQHLKNRIDRP